MKHPRIPWLVILVASVFTLWYIGPDFSRAHIVKVQTFDDKCILQPTILSHDYCQYIHQNCDASYYSIATFYYCNQYYPSIPMAIAISILILLGISTICIALSILVSNYLFKNLNELTTKFHIGTSILSFILVPLSNSFADLINYNVAFQTGSSDLVIGELIGSLLILFTIIIGSISFLYSPYKVLHPKLLLIDLLWVLLILIIFLFILSDGKFTWIECLIMTILYVGYVIFLYISDKDKLDWYDEDLNLNDAVSILSDDMKHRDEHAEAANEIENYQSCEDTSSSLKAPVPRVLTSNSLLSIAPSSNYHDSRFNSNYHDINRSRSPIYEVFQNIEETVFEESINSMKLIFNAIDMSLFLLIPINVDVDGDDVDNIDHTVVFDEENQAIQQVDITSTFIEKALGWKRLQNSPLLKYWYVVITTSLIDFQFLHLPYDQLSLIILIAMAIIGLTHRYIPKYYRQIAVNLVGITSSIIITSNISVEILQILKNLGLLWKISEYLLGLVVFSLSNSLNDFITNLTLSSINPSFGINACLGTPMITILLGIGFNGLFVIHETHEAIKITLTKSVIISMASLILVILLYLVYLPLNKWQFDKRIGIITTAWYLGLMGINFYLGK